MAAPIITLLTDFGSRDAFVGVMKGVILGIAPDVRLIDLTHEIPAQDLIAGALILRSAVPYFPAGSVHVAVVDPGVGSARRAIVVETDRGLLVGPDNGVLEPAAARLGRRCVRAIENHAWLHHPVSSTFHGRDIFAPVAAHLARGDDPAAVGPLIDGMIELQPPPVRVGDQQIDGEVIHVDAFGNLLTNIGAEALGRFPAANLSVTIGHTRVTGLATAYAAVPPGVAVALVNSWGVLEVAVRNGNAARALSAGRGTPVTVELQRA
jgi:S-adenosylmethionine hydrolase